MKAKQPSRTVYYVLQTNKRATLTTASVYHPRSNTSGSSLNTSRYVVSPRTVIDYIGFEPIDPKKKNFICSSSQLESSVMSFASKQDAVAWFREKYRVSDDGELIVR
jgi:hypothetical protein